jgi:glycosyltransferase involved in cell wall biosynthesis
LKVTLLIPTFNEIIGMGKIMPNIKREWCDQILVVDGGSTDGTIEYCKRHGYDFVVQGRKGLRCAYLDALPYIKGDVMITFSPDGNSLPELIPPLVEKMREGYDMVIVSRYAKGAKSYDDDIITAFGNWMFTNMINVFFGSKYTDTMVMFRAYKTKLLCGLELDKDSNYAFEERLFRTRVGLEPLLSVRCAKNKLRIGEIPGDEPPRAGGQRKLEAFRWGAAHIIQIAREWVCWR